MLIMHQKSVASFLKRHVRYATGTSTTKLVHRNELPSAAYQPRIVENNKYNVWKNNNLFRAELEDERPRFSMILPPPNVTGKLHLGHALTCTIQDVLVRRKRSLGYNVLWLPGIDHAGIATQGVVEKYLKTKYNINRRNMTREEFNKAVWKWKDKYGNKISEQLETLGSSVDWSRQLFTMDPKHNHAVETAFIKLFEKGLIYRKKALVNWCHKLKSTVSDIEVENLVLKGPTEIKVSNYEKPVTFGQIVDFSYKIDDSAEYIDVSTTMPETMLGDVAVAVHPSDERYKHLQGKRVIHPFRNTTIPIIFDQFVDMKFGTGAVKITPAHSNIDYEVAIRHDLPLVQVFDETGRIKVVGNEFCGRNRYECRELLLKKLNDLGLLKKIRPHEMAIPVCSRTGDIIEHLPMEQWFLSCSKLNSRAREVVKNGQLKIHPEKFTKNWQNWTEGSRDWCISRQLWWGHQIPAYECKFGERDPLWIAAPDEKSAVLRAAKHFETSANNIHVKRDTDVLDTWFSSGVYPISALGWPESTEELKKFYPLNLMTTGHDILGFWVHRMVMLASELTEELPFNNILLHGIICDNKGSKMSKSKGNVIDPIDVINGISLLELNEKSKEMHKNGVISKEEYQKAKLYHKSNFSTTNGIPECGVDALRFTLLSNDVKSHYINFDVNICHANKLFCNKIWQSIKYIKLSLEKLPQISEEITRENLTYFDEWILSRLAHMVETTNKSIDEYDFHLATRAIKKLIYSEYCDIYLEATKPDFDNGNSKIAYAHAHTLIAVLNVALRSLSPFMVFVTEEVIPKIPQFERNIIYNFNDLSKKYFDFPTETDFNHLKKENLEIKVDKLLNVMFLVRELIGFYGIPNKPRSRISINTKDSDLQSDVSANEMVIRHLTRCGEILFEDKSSNGTFVSGSLNKDTIVSVEVIANNKNELIQAAKVKLHKKIKKLEDFIEKLESKLSNDKYLNSVPEWTLNLDRERVLNKKIELKQLHRLIML